MRKLTQKLVLSVVTMALVVIALGTSTFAWFTLTNSATIQSFEATVTSGEGIEVTLGVPNGSGNAYLEPATNTLWFTVLPSSVIQTYITTRYPNFKFLDISSPEGRTFTKYNLNTNVSSAATSGWIEIPLYFRSAVQQDIVWNTAALGGTNKPWVANVDSFIHSNGLAYGTDESLLGLDVAAWTAARISVTGSVGIASPVTTTVVYQQGVGPIAGVTNSLEMLDSYDLQGTGPYTIGAAAEGAASYAVATGKNVSIATLPTLPTTVTTVNNKVVSLKTGAFANFDTYYTGIVTVRVWIEGWDADTYDAIFATLLTAQLGFTTGTLTA